MADWRVIGGSEISLPCDWWAVKAGGGSSTHPLLAVAVLQVVDGAVVPGQPGANQHGRQEAILCQDHKVREEATESLDHTCREREKGGREGEGGRRRCGESG